MGFHLTRRVWDTSAHKGTTLLVLLAVADFADDTSATAWPSIETIAKKVRMQPRNVQLILGKLALSGELRIEIGAGPQGCNRYHIVAGGVQVSVAGGASLGTEGCKFPSQGVQSITPKLNGTIKEQEGTVEVHLNAASVDEMQSADLPHAATNLETTTLIAVAPQPLDFVAAPPAAKPRDELAVVLAEVCRIDPDLASPRQRDKLNAAYKLLKAAGHTAVEVRAVGKWWAKHDWRGLKGSPPTPAQVGEVWAEAMAAQPKVVIAPPPVDDEPVEVAPPGSISRLKAERDAKRGSYWLPADAAERRVAA